MVVATLVQIAQQYVPPHPPRDSDTAGGTLLDSLLLICYSLAAGALIAAVLLGLLFLVLGKADPYSRLVSFAGAVGVTAGIAAAIASYVYLEFYNVELAKTITDYSYFGCAVVVVAFIVAGIIGGFLKNVFSDP